MKCQASYKADNKPLSIFISYAHGDETYRIELEKHLKLLQRQGLIAVWHDRKIDAGSEWEGEIHAHLETADIVLLLISADFVASDYCWDVEMVSAMRHHMMGQCRVIPIILRTVDDWQSSPFGTLQALPTDGKPISSWSNEDEAYACVAQGIRTAISSPKHACSVSETVSWFLTLEPDLSKNARNKVLQRLRQYLNEQLVALLGVEEGSTKLRIESSKSAYDKARIAHNDGVLEEALGHAVTGISEPIGALIRVRTEEVTDAPSSNVLIEPVHENELFEPLVISMKVDPKDPVHPGLNLASHPNKTYSDQDLISIGQKLGTYLNTFLVVSKDKLTANLSPFEEGCGLPIPIRRTELGLKLLQQDLDLKVITGHLLHPETPTGAAFWKAMVSKEKVDFVTRVWITPGQCTLEEKEKEGSVNVSIKKMRFQVLCETDYSQTSQVNREEASTDRAIEVFRGIILPELEKRVYLSSRFSDLRQLLSVLIMAKWLEDNMGPLLQQFVNSDDTSKYEEPGVDQKIALIKQQYLDLIKNGAWSYRRRSVEDKSVSQQTYIVGGIDFDSEKTFDNFV